MSNLEWIRFMGPDDEVGVLTLDGEFAGVVGPSMGYVVERADQLQEAMIAVMKVPDHRKGWWLWRIGYGWTQIRGMRF